MEENKLLNNILNKIISVEEKIDGSQFSFGLYAGEIRMRSKGAVVRLDDGNKMFSAAVTSVPRTLAIARNIKLD